MQLEVRRELIPIGITSQWEQHPYTQVVWKHDGQMAVFPVVVPHDYTLGLLRPYLDGVAVSLPIFDAALAMIPYSRREMERDIAAVTTQSRP